MITGGFGMQMDLETGASRAWYVDRFGVKRWVDDNAPIEPPEDTEQT